MRKFLCIFLLGCSSVYSQQSTLEIVGVLDDGKVYISSKDGQKEHVCICYEQGWRAQELHKDERGFFIYHKDLISNKPLIIKLK